MSDSLKKNFVVDYYLPEFTFTVDGKEYSLRYDFGAFRAFQKAGGTDPLSPDFEISAINLDSFLWAGLRSENPEVTLEQIRKWLTPMTARGLLKCAGEAYFGAFPEPDPKDPSTDPLNA